ncbi:response regulator [Terricaulis sp.]|uniref:response regulator n=1 Tax=Terricaulis sp. TaxID=2768686 RepID=UPI003782E772
MAPEDPHILVVDDHREIRESLAQFLRKNGRRSTAVENAEAARKAIKENRIDLVILDIMMPGEDGLQLCRHIRESNHIPVILLSARAEELDRIIGLEVGADDYVVKPFNPRELLARIDAVLRRTHALPPSAETPTGDALRFDRWTLKLAERELVDDSGVAHELSTGEYRLLLTFLQRPKVVLSRDQLLDLAFDRGSDVFDRAVDTQVSRLRRKIETDARTPKLIKTVWGGGYVFTAPVEKA